MGFTKESTVLDGAITFEMIAFTPLAVGIRLKRMYALVGREDLDTAEMTFATCEALTTAIVIDKLSAEMSALGDYWDHRTGDLAHDWELFQNRISPAVMSAWWAAYGQTRDKAMGAPVEAQRATPETTNPEA